MTTDATDEAAFEADEDAVRQVLLDAWGFSDDLNNLITRARKAFGRILAARSSQRPSPSVGREEVARIIYALDPIYDSGENVDGFQVAPGGDLSWEQFSDQCAEFGDDPIFHGWNDKREAILKAADAILAQPATVAVEGEDDQRFIDSVNEAWAESARLDALIHEAPTPPAGEWTDEQVEAAVRAYREVVREPGDPPIEGPYGWQPAWKARQIAAMRAALATITPTAGGK